MYRTTQDLNSNEYREIDAEFKTTLIEKVTLELLIADLITLHKVRIWWSTQNDRIRSGV